MQGNPQQIIAALMAPKPSPAPQPWSVPPYTPAPWPGVVKPPDTGDDNVLPPNPVAPTAAPAVTTADLNSLQPFGIK